MFQKDMALAMLGSTLTVIIYIYKERKKKMVKNIALILSLMITQEILSQKVFAVGIMSRADVKVFVVDYESKADLLVYKVDYESRAGKIMGSGFFVDYASR